MADSQEPNAKEGAGEVDLAQLVASIRTAFASEVERVTAQPRPEHVEQVRIAFLGRKGSVTRALEALRQVPKADRAAAGKLVNTLRQEVEAQIEALRTRSQAWLLEQALAQPAIDVTLPAGERRPGNLHPVSLIRAELSDVFHRLGFTIEDGPEIDLDFYNFSALNFADDHPARDMQDTFFVKPTNELPDPLVLRTHTSNIQIHALLNHPPPVRFVALGRVYRCDSDLTHTPMFHQVEGVVADRGISFGHLRGTIEEFIKGVFGEALKTRFRPSFFPFVEPGAEFDMQCFSCRGAGCRLCKHTGWIELGGCGMIHPNVFEAVGYDSETYSGFAFGFGIDRMAMMKYGLPDLRQLFEGSRHLLEQFPTFPPQAQLAREA